MAIGSRGRAGVAAALVLSSAVARGASGQVLYSQNFEVDSTPSWSVFKGPVTTDEAHNFFFNYASVGIPGAPSGTGTRGMKLQANLFNGVFGGMSVSPTGESFTGNYALSFDWWANFNGPFPGGGSGSTMLSTFGLATGGTAAQWPGAGPATDSVYFAATADGNSASDWRAYSPAANAGYLDTVPGVYAAGAHAGSRNQSDPYYAPFGGVGAPAAQLALYPQQTGTTLVGSAGMRWHRVHIDKRGNIITWRVRGRLIATVDTTGMVLGGSNIFFGHSDVNSTSSMDLNDVNLLFTLIDNIQVVRCRADFTNGGLVNVTDIFAFLTAWFAGNISADFNGDGVVNVAEIFDFLTAWFAGC